MIPSEPSTIQQIDCSAFFGRTEVGGAAGARVTLSGITVTSRTHAHITRVWLLSSLILSAVKWAVGELRVQALRKHHNSCTLSQLAKRWAGPINCMTPLLTLRGSSRGSRLKTDLQLSLLSWE
jgi:hypothetical protein